MRSPGDRTCDSTIFVPARCWRVGATLSELMSRLGHSTPSAAMRYQHASRDRDAAIAAALSELDLDTHQAAPDTTTLRPHHDTACASEGNYTYVLWGFSIGAVVWHRHRIRHVPTASLPGSVDRDATLREGVPMVSRTADNPEPGRQLISLETAAKQLECSTRTVRRLIASGYRPASHRRPAATRVPRPKLMRSALRPHRRLTAVDERSRAQPGAATNESTLDQTVDEWTRHGPLLPVLRHERRRREHAVSATSPENTAVNVRLPD